MTYPLHPPALSTAQNPSSLRHRHLAGSRETAPLNAAQSEGAAGVKSAERLALEVALAAPGAPKAASACPGPMPLAPADLVWARMPGPAPVPTGVMRFGGHIGRPTAEMLVRKLFAAPVFARRFTTTPAGTLAWEKVSHIEVAQHLRHHVLDCAGDSPQVHAAMAHWCRQPLTPGQPPWEAGWVDCTDISYLFVRVHHALTDGPGMLAALLSCHDDPAARKRAEAMAAAMLARARPPVSAPSPKAGVPARVRATLGGLVNAAARGCMLAVQVGLAAWQVAVRRPDRITSLKPAHAVTHLEYACVPRRWPVDTLKAIAAARGGGTVNDVLVAVFTGALRDVLTPKERAGGVPALRSMQTVNLPAPWSADGIRGNHVGLAMADLPVGEDGVHARWQQVSDIMRRFKNSAEPLLGAWGMAWVSRLPQAIVDFMHRRTTSQCSVFISNVMGPTEPFVLDGHRADNMFWFAPRFGNVGILFPVISYAGAVQVAVQVDAGLPVRAHELARRVQARIEELARAEPA